MKNSPTLNEIKNWIIANNPLGIFVDSKNIKIENIDPKPWSGHFNFLIIVKDRRFVLRFKGPEWGTSEGTKNEYKILTGVEKYNVGPKVYYLTEDFFGESVMLMEYLEGHVFTALDRTEQDNLFDDAAHFIACINRIPFQKDDFPFQESMESYDKNKKTWRKRIAEIKQHPKLFGIGDKIENKLPALEKQLDKFEPLLKKIIKKHGLSFIFESSHAGHLLRTDDGFRFLNWEQVGFGDPSFMLAVFLYSIKNRDNFEQIKKEMVEAYLEKNSIDDFEKLLNQRLWERHISNTIYRIWTEARKNEKEMDLDTKKQKKFL